MAQAGGRHRRRRRDARRDLDRQGRRRGSRRRPPGTIVEDPRRRGRHGRGRRAAGRDLRPTAAARVDRRHAGVGESPPATPEEAVAAATTEAEGVAATEASVGETIDIVTPTGGESVTEGTILEWSVKVGDAVKQGDTVVEISTDKVDMELPAPATGQITEILAAGRRDRDRRPGDRAHDRRRARRPPQPPRRSRRRHGRRPTASPRGPAAAARRPTAGNASPVARRVAAAAGHRPDGRPRQRARRPDHQGRRARGRGGQRRAPPRAAATAGRAKRRPAPTLIKGGAAVLARYMDESRSIPTATSFRTLTVTELEQRRSAAQGGRAPRLVHPPDRLRDRARGHRGACR